MAKLLIKFDKTFNTVLSDLKQLSSTLCQIEKLTNSSKFLLVEIIICTNNYFK